MTAPITVYRFETSGDTPASDYETQDYEEAKRYAREHGFAVIAHEYEWSDSELLEDYRGDR